MRKILFLHILWLSRAEDSLIYTMAGSGKGRPCRFPFIHKGIEYSNCTEASIIDPKQG